MFIVVPPPGDPPDDELAQAVSVTADAMMTVSPVTGFRSSAIIGTSPS
jgi:hypothetical protein